MLDQFRRAQVFTGNLSRVAVQPVDLIIEAPHRLGVEFASQAIEHGSKLGILAQRFAPHQRHGFVGREIVAVVSELHEVEPGDAAVGRVAGGEVERAPGDGFVQKVPIHFARRVREVQIIRLDQPRISVSAVHELGSEAGADRRDVIAQVGNLFDPQALGLRAPHEDRERVLEAERVEALDTVALAQLAHAAEHAPGVVHGRLVQDRR